MGALKFFKSKERERDRNYCTKKREKKHGSRKNGPFAQITIGRGLS